MAILIPSWKPRWRKRRSAVARPRSRTWSRGEARRKVPPHLWNNTHDGDLRSDRSLLMARWMAHRLSVLLAVGVVGAAAESGPARGQAYPSKVINIVVP